MTVNAPLDPTGRDQMTPAELARTFNVVRGDVLFDKFSSFPRFEDVSSFGEHVFFRGEDVPEAVLFVSHRWQTASHPDPSGEQLAALRTFLSCVKELCTVEGGPSRRVIRTVTLGVFGRSSRAIKRLVYSHGGFQAAYFLGDYNSFDPASRSKLLALGDAVLNKIGVWYDYSCMPQDTSTRADLVFALGRIHELLGASNLIALRYPGDNYESRAWCAAEVATDPDIERTRFRKICLRLDTIGSQFPPDLLREQPAHWAGIPDVTIKQIDRAETGADAANAISSFIRMVGTDAEDERDLPLFFVKRKPWIFEGQREFMILVMTSLAELSTADQERVPDSGRFSLGFDLAKAVAEAAVAVGLASSEPADIPYTALLILYGRHRGVPRLAQLFGDCLRRRVNGRTTVLARYREDREPYNERCWYRFEDEISGTPARAWSDA